MTSRSATRAAIVAVAFMMSLGPAQRSPAFAQTPVARADSVDSRRTSPDTALNELTRSVAAELRCPVCQGLSLADSPSELALEMKDVVREQLAAGRTPDEVKAYFVAKYGEWILLEPPPRGVNLLAYVLPGIALVGGLGVIWVALRRWTSRAPVHEELAGPDEMD